MGAGHEVVEVAVSRAEEEELWAGRGKGVPWEGEDGEENEAVREREEAGIGGSRLGPPEGGVDAAGDGYGPPGGDGGVGRGKTERGRLYPQVHRGGRELG